MKRFNYFTTSCSTAISVCECRNVLLLSGHVQAADSYQAGEVSAIRVNLRGKRRQVYLVGSSLNKMWELEKMVS